MPSTSVPWNGNYDGSGSAFDEFAGANRRIYSAPSLFRTSLGTAPDRVNEDYSTSGSTGSESNGSQVWSMGLWWRGSDRAINHIHLTYPSRNGGITSYNFPLEKPLSWLTLKEGERLSSSTVDNQFEVTLLRSGPTSWRFDFQRSSQRGAVRELQANSGFLTITGNQSAPPWHEFRFTSEIRGAAVVFAQDFLLNLCSPSDSECGSPSP